MTTIRKGRNEMANALRNNQVAPLQCAWYAPTTMDVELRAVMHQDVSGTSSCSVTAWLGTLDLLGWGLEVEKMIYLQYVVNEDDLMVTGYSEISLSQNIHMNKLTPNAEGIDLLLVNGNQFDSLVLLNSSLPMKKLMILLMAFTRKFDDFKLQTSEEGVMLLLRAILALKSSSWIEAWSSCSSVCSTGLAFIRFNEDRWPVYIQESRSKYPLLQEVAD